MAEFGELDRGGRADDLGVDLRRRHAGARSGRRSGRPGRSWSPTRTCSTRRSCPITPSGSSCSSSSATSSIDELHTYRGVFGSHVANVLRRLLRICAHYGSHPVIVCCSATIGNPAELATMLTGRPVRLVDRNGAPAGERHVVLVDPPILESARAAPAARR